MVWTLLGAAWGTPGASRGPRGGDPNAIVSGIVSGVVSGMVSGIVSGIVWWGFGVPQGEGREGVSTTKESYSHNV